MENERWKLEREASTRSTTAIRGVGALAWLVVVVTVIWTIVLLVYGEFWAGVITLVGGLVQAMLLFAVSSIGKHVLDVKRLMLQDREAAKG